MPSPGITSCTLCSRPLAVESASGLCAECLATVPTVDTPRASPHPDAPTASFNDDFSIDHPSDERSTGFVDPATRTPPPQDAPTATSPAAAPRRPDAPPGFELLRDLGGGGMGRVFLAKEHAADRIVAIKFLNAPSDPTAFDRFLVEVQSQVKLRHPHIIEVITVEGNGREPFFTMEVAEGSLSKHATPSGLLPPKEAARLVMQAAEGIAFAHSKQVLHRDLKPGNILLSRDAEGRRLAKVSDFGLAKRTDRDDGLTVTGALGTASYMSPEAAAGRHREIDEPSDVYGLGATLYHLLTGRPPYSGVNNLDTARMVVHDPLVRPRSIRPDVPPGLEAIVMKAMEKSPSQRYRSAAEFAGDLERHLEGHRQKAPEHSRLRRLKKWFGRNRMKFAAALLVIALSGVLVAAGFEWRDRQPAPEPPDPVEEYLASVREKLKAGEPVTLIGETGLPTYHRFWFEQASFQKEPNGTCSFRAFATNLMQLSPPDMGLDHYEVSLELQHLGAAVVGGNDADSISFYFGHSHTAVDESRTAHVLFAVQYKDYEMPGRAQPRGVHLLSTGFIEDTRSTTGVETWPGIKHASRIFTPTPSKPGALRPEPGDWRPIVATISPQGVRIQWLSDPEPEKPARMVDLASWNRETVDRNFAAQVKNTAKRMGKTELPLKWSSSLPFGIRASKSAVAVRKVRITPLPRTT